MINFVDNKVFGVVKPNEASEISKVFRMGAQWIVRSEKQTTEFNTIYTR
jgi:hypothetical protein